MRLNLLSYVSIAALTVLVHGVVVPHAQAGFEFVPSPQVQAVPPRQDTMTMPAVSAPIVDEMPLEAMPAPAVSSPAPVAAPAPMRVQPAPVLSAPVVQESPAVRVPVAPTTRVPMRVEPKPMPAPAPAPMKAVMDEPPMPAPVMPAPVMSKPLAIAQNPAPVMPPVTSVVKSSDSFIKACPKDSPATALLSSDTSENAVVEGFGRQVPLVLALQQIVPAHYRYAFDGEVQPGMRVDWTGGQPWKAIIVDLARDNGMHVDIVSNVVAFRRKTPMDIIDANTSIDMDASVVQGVPLRAPMPIMPSEMRATPMASAPVAASVSSASSASSAPSDIAWTELPPVDASAQMPAAREELASMSESVQGTVSQTEEVVQENVAWNSENNARTDLSRQLKEARAEAYGAEMMPENQSMNKPAEKQVAEKVILTADADNAPMDVSASAIASSDVAWQAAPQAVEPSAAPAAAPVDLTQGYGAMPAPVMASAEASPAVEQVPAATTVDSVQMWHAQKNDTLRQTLTAWCEQSGVSLVWSSDYDYPLQTDVQLNADFGDAVRTLLDGFAKAEPRPVGRLFQNQKVGAQPVLVIETQRLTD